jgi:GNAT superfamily N-acetyltransferase
MPGRGLARAVVLARYLPALAVMGMLLAASRHGRRGVGRTLVQHVLAQVPGQVVYLHATPQGRPLYEQLGFTVTGA